MMMTKMTLMTPLMRTLPTLTSTDPGLVAAVVTEAANMSVIQSIQKELTLMKSEKKTLMKIMKKTD